MDITSGFIFTSSFGCVYPSLSFNKELEEFSLHLEKTTPSLSISNRHGYHSDYLSGDIPIIKKFFDAIKPSVQEYISTLHIQTPYRIYFDKPWININRKGGSNIAHNHPHRFLSAVYYVKTPPNCGDLCFLNTRCPNLFVLKTTKHTNENSSFWKIKAAVGNLIIFPADILHSVESNQSEEARISLVFNIDIDQIDNS
jgi:uncharacterized protein (TIGR02466 family)|tara:strand:- start:422 stop:1015 length:594 start_codon:yes stop_codon:yes gene_type:complete